jgi:transcriptional regulator with XRE-family HTH domain
MSTQTSNYTAIQTRKLQALAVSNGSPPVLEVDVGSRLRALRTERKLSIRLLAEKSGLSINTLGLIENGKTSPSVSTLQQIAIALEVPIAAFFELNLPESSVAHIKASRRPRIAFEHGVLEDLGAGLTDRAVEPFVVRLEPLANSGPNPIVHTGMSSFSV